MCIASLIGFATLAWVNRTEGCLDTAAGTDAHERHTQRSSWFLGLAQCEVRNRCLTAAHFAGDLALTDTLRCKLGEVVFPLHARRSEEHTSELQSPCNLVCRLLLEKKKPTAL